MGPFKRGKFKLLILGAGRGGTSLVASLLDAHSQWNVAVEAHAADYLLGEALKEDSLKARLSGFEKACRAEARATGTAWGNKVTTEQLDFLYALAEPEAVRAAVRKHLFQGRKVIFVLRDGRTCVHSKLQRTDADLGTAVARWKASVEWLRYLKTLKIDLHILRFEQLLQRPQEQLESLCTFLATPFEPQMMGGTNSNRLPEEYRRQAIDPEKSLVPKHALAYTELMEEELRELGYC